MSEIPIILVRHGISCANKRKKINKEKWISDHTKIMDPALTNEGKENAELLGLKLKDKLDKDYPNRIVCASVLLRTQLTAQLMLNPPKIVILPYISETGFFKTNDNTPDPDNREDKISKSAEYNSLKEKAIKIASFPTDGNSPNVAKFINFVKNNYSTLSTNSTPALIIFTHGHFIEECVKTTTGKILDKSERPNYSAFRFSLNRNTGAFTYSEPYKYYKEEHKTFMSMRDTCRPEDNNLCGFNVCDPSVPVATSAVTTWKGGARKTRRRRKSTKRDRRSRRR